MRGSVGGGARPEAEAKPKHALRTWCLSYNQLEKRKRTGGQRQEEGEGSGAQKGKAQAWGGTMARREAFWRWAGGGSTHVVASLRWEITALPPPSPHAPHTHCPCPDITTNGAASTHTDR